MLVIFLYGPPASGKLTVAKELSRLTGFPILHNQLTIDLLADFFQFETKKFSKVNKKIRREILSAFMTTRSRGLIMTYAWSLESAADHKDVKRYRSIITSNGGKMVFVELRCDPQELYRRVKSVSRKQHKKIRTKKKLAELLSAHDFSTRVYSHRLGRRLICDTTKILPRRTAQKILTTNMPHIKIYSPHSGQTT